MAYTELPIKKLSFYVLLQLHYVSAYNWIHPESNWIWRLELLEALVEDKAYPVLISSTKAATVLTEEIIFHKGKGEVSTFNPNKFM